jgi:transcriptional regulator with XRE-family HTH domain
LAQTSFFGMQPLADNLRRRATELGISHSEAARRAGLSERRYGNYISDRREPDLRTLLQIARALNTTPNEMLGINEAEEEDTHTDRLRTEIAASLKTLDQRQLELLLQQVRAWGTPSP